MRDVISVSLRRASSAWPHLAFVGLIVVSLRDVLAMPGTIGLAWDWEVPVFAEAIQQQISRYFYIWDYQLRGGFFSPYRPEGLLYALSFPLSLFGGEIFTKVSVIVLMFLAANSMRRLAGDILELTPWWSTFAGTLYMLSPVFYSRLMAGHMHLLFPYALLPLLFDFCWRILRAPSIGNRRSIREAVGAGMILGLEGIHPSFLLISFSIVGLLFGFNLLRVGLRKSNPWGIGVMLLVFSLISAFWAWPSGLGYLTTGTLYHSGWPPQEPSQVSQATVISKQANLFQYTVQPLDQVLRLHSATGINTEYTYPVPPGLDTIWLFASFLLPLAVFGGLLSRNRASDAIAALAFLGLVGATVVAGTNVVTGTLLSEWLLLNVFPIWAQFGNTVRALPLVALSFSALAPLMFQRVVAGMGRSRKMAFSAFALIFLLVYTSPFLSGQVLNQQNPLPLKVYEPTSEDRMIYDYLKSDREDSRVTFVPPPWLGNPEYYALNYEWMVGLSPHPEFLQPYVNPAAWSAVSDFLSDIPASVAGKILGLANVKYIIYPRGRYLFPPSARFPKGNAPTIFSATEQTNSRILAAQKNLSPVPQVFPTTTLYRNEAFLPHIYAASRSLLVQGDSDSLTALADSTFFALQPAIFFDAQQPSNPTQLASQVDTLVRPQALLSQLSPSDSRNPAFLFSPLTSSSADISFSLPRDSRYVIRARVEPFQDLPTKPADVLAATVESKATEPNIGWSANVLYNYYVIETKTLQAAAYLGGATAPDEYVQMEEGTGILNLEQYPYLKIETLVEEPSFQAIQVQLDLDFNGDRQTDATWTSQLLSHPKFKEDSINALEVVREQFPNQPDYHVVGVTIRFKERPPSEWSKPDYARQLYVYSVNGIGFYRNAAGDEKPGWSQEYPVNWNHRPEVFLVRSLQGAHLLQLPVSLAYQVDGPATFLATLDLAVQDTQGETKRLDMGSQILEPFSEGTITLDSRNQLTEIETHETAQSPTERSQNAPKVEVSAQHLLGNPELRPTTLALTHAGTFRIPQSADQPGIVPLTLDMDGGQLELNAMSSVDPGQNRAWFSTKGLSLAQGKHQLSVRYSDADPKYRVDSVEIEPLEDKTAAKAQPSISFRKINPTRYLVHVENAQAPFFLVFSESFSADWHAYFVKSSTESLQTSVQTSWYEPSALLSWLLDGTQRVEMPEHARVNGYANSWYIQEKGSYDIVLEFVPQRLYEVGWIVTLGTLLGCAVFLIVGWLRRGRKERAEYPKPSHIGPNFAG